MSRGSTPDRMACVVGLGGNVGDPAAAIRHAFLALDELPGTRLVSASTLYRTAAWGVTAQADFVNAAALLETSLSAEALLAGLLEIERAFGRDRDAVDAERWGPRTLDLDLLLYGAERIDCPGLTVPHPLLHRRAFALVPLLEVAPGADIPGIGPAADALAAIASDDIRALG
ncbi:2-amino-4-hydroxy-6-hydroxymethyldihydropteridine diphosphokinase [Lysobacter sp. A3-1-A15]|uniref:2-amino-4-hydroxy-6- hydroxymethyldihydropteridine diphosphokinase n=1 Tax=Novilysobacter viscosus TaxID=3098602 RepID=UPI003983DA76